MKRELSRRRVLHGAAAGAVGVAGVAALAACGETQVVEKIVTQTVEVEKIVTKQVPVTQTVEKIVEVAAPASPTAGRVKFEYVSDHVSGVRGKSTRWALEKFAQLRPNVDIKFTPQAGSFVEAFAIRMAAGTAPEAALLSWGFFHSRQDDFVQINDVLDKHPDFDAGALIAEPDSYTVNYDLGFPFTDKFSGAAFGQPYQGNVSGHYYNIDFYEAAGVEAPTADWTYSGEWLEAAKRLTDKERDQWGTRLASGTDIHFWTPISWGFGGKQFIAPEGDHMSVFEDGGDLGAKFAWDLIKTHEVGPPVASQKELAGEFGDAFSAGKIGGELRRGDAKGNTITRIKDRFRWSLAPQPKGDVTGTAAVHRTNQGQYVLKSAERAGTVEAVTDFLVWMAGPSMQARAAIDRGFLPCRFDALESPENLAAPPERQDLLVTFVNSEFRTWQGYHPTYEEWISGWRQILNKAFAGDDAVESAMDESAAFSREVLSRGVDVLEERKARWGSTA